MVGLWRDYMKASRPRTKRESTFGSNTAVRGAITPAHRRPYPLFGANLIIARAALDEDPVLILVTQSSCRRCPRFWHSACRKSELRRKS